MPRLSPQTSLRILVGAAAVSLLLSIALWIDGQVSASIFVGLWVPSILSLGSLFLGFAALRRSERALRTAHSATVSGARPAVTNQSEGA